MRSLLHPSTLQFILLGLLAAGSWGCTPAAQPPVAQHTAPPGTATPSPTSMAAHEWLLIDLPADATQLQFGAEVYRLVCQDCHGDKGQGLTPEWRATWAPPDQNCWQSKCHAANHPPEGFILPVAPAIVGKAALSQFATANELHAFIQAQMPWYRPGSLTEKDNWGVTAYVLQMNQIPPGKVLDAATAAQILLR